MDFFGDDDDEEGLGMGEGGSRDLSQLSAEERRSKRLWEMSQEILKFVLSRRDHLTQSEILMISEDPLCDQVCPALLLSSSPSSCLQMEDLIKKFHQVKVGAPLVLSGESLAASGIYYPSTRSSPPLSISLSFDPYAESRESLIL